MRSARLNLSAFAANDQYLVISGNNGESNQGAMLAVHDLRTGQLSWKKASLGDWGPNSRIQLHSNALYVITRGAARKLEITTGKELWSAKPDTISVDN